MRAARITLVAACVIPIGAACGDDDTVSPPPAGCRAAVGGRVEIVARDLAWDTDCLEAPAGEPLVLEIDNRDDGVNHNLHLTDAPEEPSTVLELGPRVQELEVTLPAGAYDFVCDLHPTMVGTLRVDGQVTPPG